MAPGQNGLTRQMALLLEKVKELPQEAEPCGAGCGGQALPGGGIEPGIDIFGCDAAEILGQMTLVGLGQEGGEVLDGGEDEFDGAWGTLSGLLQGEISREVVLIGLAQGAEPGAIGELIEVDHVESPFVQTPGMA
jgi:hypothetical protein